MKSFVNIGSSLLGVTVCGLTAGCSDEGAQQRPNVVYIFADQWRGQDVGYMGNGDVRTPNIDRLASQGVVLTRVVSNCPVSSPYRGSLLTGTYPLTNGIFYNDKPLSDRPTVIGEAYRDAGYNTAYVGKWHIDGRGRDTFIPRERRGGFDYWKVRECTHDYNNSFYYADTPDTLVWEGYDAIAQAEDVIRYFDGCDREKPFAMFLSWGPPHDPYHTAPEKYRELYSDLSKIKLRPNVPVEDTLRAKQMIAGYYAHIAALDDCVGMLIESLKSTGLWDNTVFVFTSDHGDLLLSHGQTNKQQPYDESILVPFIIHYPGMAGQAGRRLDFPVNTPDIMPTLLSMAGVAIPETVEGRDVSPYLKGEAVPADTASLIACYVPFGQWSYARGGREYRGIRTPRYTYVRDLKGPWLMFDNVADPYQTDNLCGRGECAGLQKRLDDALNAILAEQGDRFLSGPEYMAMWNYSFHSGDEPPG